MSSPEVTTKYGQIRGLHHELQSGGVANIFLGIPFAKPPVEELRFEKPQPPEPWTETLDVTKWKPSCQPFAIEQESAGGYSEDSLYLNIFAPSEKSSEPKGYPVLFWIHGGAFIFGDASSDGYEGFANNYVSRDLIVVTIQYRLSAYGFLALENDSEFRGNLGLFDQAEALKFVHENIAAFGGDPGRITVGGESAGAASTSFLVLSPVSRDHVSATIEMSGSAWDPWPRCRVTQKYSAQFIEYLGLSGQSGEELKKSLKKKTTAELIEASAKLGNSEDGLYWKFGPTIDGEFLPAPPEELIKTAPPKPTLLGLSEKEALIITTRPFPGQTGFPVHPDDWPAFNERNIIDVIRKHIANEFHFGNNAAAAEKLLIDEYVSKNVPTSPDYKFYLQRYNKLISDAMFNWGSVAEAEIKRDLGWPVFLYLFEHYNPAIFSEDAPDKGATHASEFPYITGTFLLGEFEMDDRELAVKSTFVDAFVSFGKEKRPVSESLEWPLAESLRYVSIKPEPEIKTGFFAEELQFYKKLWDLGFTRYPKDEQLTNSVINE